MAKIDVEKVEEILVKFNCNKDGYCKYNGENCYEGCKIKKYINTIKEEAKKQEGENECKIKLVYRR